MKVTKIIREYVEEQVGKIYDNKIVDTWEMEKNLRKKVENIVNEYLQQINDNITDFLKKENIEVIPRYKQDPFIVSLVSLEFPQAEKQDKINSKLKAEKACKIREILATLELGGTKKDLDEMLAKIAEEIK